MPCRRTQVVSLIFGERRGNVLWKFHHFFYQDSKPNETPRPRRANQNDMTRQRWHAPNWFKTTLLSISCSRNHDQYCLMKESIAVPETQATQSTYVIMVTVGYLVLEFLRRLNHLHIFLLFDGLSISCLGKHDQSFSMPESIAVPETQTTYSTIVMWLWLPIIQ